ncbi:MAG: hypothetical protein AB7G47_20420 [Mycolicibacterium sp.]|uniref:hypothetical protein n=1 Tax=Mycolicibacterium sp. TaxID=2320850 RepID=UPI003D10127A
MVATLGLERVESTLRRDAISATDVTDFLHRADAGEIDALARNGMNSALDSLHRRLNERDSVTGGLVDHSHESDLPSRQYFQHPINPEFQQTPHANPV